MVVIVLFQITIYLLVKLTLASALKVCDRSTSPRWNEAFCYLVQNPREDILVIKVGWIQRLIKAL